MDLEGQSRAWRAKELSTFLEKVCHTLKWEQVPLTTANLF